MIRRAVVSLLLLFGVLVTPHLVGIGSSTVGAASPVLSPLDPVRLLDTRPTGTTIDGQAQRSGIQAGKTTFELPVTGRGGVPVNAAAVMLNVTAVTPTGLGFITVYPCGIERPLASNLNFTDTNIPNAVLAKVGVDGKVCVYTETTTHILADVNAYVPKDASPTPLNPARLLDTRPGGETTDGQAQGGGIQAGSTILELSVAGRGGVPADASAVMLNITAVTPTGLGFITVYPCGIERPLASNLNFTDTNIPNAVFAKVGANGTVCIYTETTTHILADVNAYVAGSASPTPLDPARLLDTRPGGETIDGRAQRTGIQADKATFELSVAGRGGVPTDATAVMLNVTAATPTGLGFITVYPCGIERPLASSLNFTTTTIPNAVLAKIGAAGTVCIYTSTSTHIIADVNAYVPASTDTAGPTTSSSTAPTSSSSSTTTTTTKPPKPACTDTTIPLTECRALVALFKSTGGPNWTTNAGWNTGADPCIWYGVSCNANRTSVRRVVLTDNRLSGPVPGELGDLTGLNNLTLSNNQLTALPPEIGNLTKLTGLTLFNNQLTALPPEIGNLTNLANLSLSNNSLIALPPEIGALTNLTGLSASYNSLAGLPPEIGALTKLSTLAVDHNQLTALPTAIVNLNNLNNLSLVGNRLTTLPPEIGSLTNLTGLSLSDNGLSSLPPQIGALTKLSTLAVDHNQLTALPTTIVNLDNLSTLSLVGNQLTTLPTGLTQLAKLSRLNLSDNLFTEIPTEIFGLTNLTVLEMDNNTVTALPAGIGDLVNLTGLTFFNNKLTALPAEIGKLTNLTFLNLSDNEISSGEMATPMEPLRRAGKLTMLSLHGNGCLSTQNEDLAAWLTRLDPAWSDGC